MVSHSDLSEFFFLVRQTSLQSQLRAEQAFPQHGTTVCLLHSVAVAYYCSRIARALSPLGFRRTELIRGALLHDYFLYDWHDPDPNHRLHGFHHAARALANAERDIPLTTIERNIILRHMFPLTPIPPRYKESILVCLVDKACSFYEIFGRRTYPNRQIQTAMALISSCPSTQARK